MTPRQRKAYPSSERKIPLREKGGTRLGNIIPEKEQRGKEGRGTRCFGSVC
jgi:hypothetical protein